MPTAGDEDLLRAAGGDLHQEASDVIAPDKPVGERRELGKVFNSAVVGLISPQGWDTKLRRRGIHILGTRVREMPQRWWAPVRVCTPIPGRLGGAAPSVLSS